MQVAVYGPNLRAPETFHVHAPGCADTRKALYAGHNAWLVECSSLVDLSDEAYPPEDFECESGEFTGEFKVFACAKALPVN